MLVCPASAGAVSSIPSTAKKEKKGKELPFLVQVQQKEQKKTES
jgi:hypothetical protein